MKRFLPVIAMAVWFVAIPRAALAQVAFDNASQPAYASGWQAGSNGGTGFGPWAFDFSGDSAALMHPGPQFIATTALAGNSLATPTFALTTSDRPFFFDTSAATRPLAVQLAVGQTFQADVDGSALNPAAPGFSIGNTVQLFGSDGVERWGMFTNNGFSNDHWVATSNMDTTIPAANSFHLAFTLTGTDTYDLLLTPVGGGAAIFSQSGATLAGTAGIGIDSLRFSAYGTGSTADGSAELFFNNLGVVAGVPEPGSLCLVALGAAGVLGRVRRRSRR